MDKDKSVLIFEYKREKLLKAMESFSYTAKVPVTLADGDMKTVWECLGERKLCAAFLKHDNCNKECKINLERAAMTAINMNEPYVFMCASGLVGIIYPIMEETTLKGAFLVGPIIVAKTKDGALKKLFKNLPDFRSYVNEVLDIVDLNEIRTTAEVSHMYEVFCDCIFSYKLLKADPAPDNSFVYNLERSVKDGDKENAVANMELLYDRAYILNSGNVNQIKYYISDCIECIIENINFENITAIKEEQLLERLKNAASSDEIYGAAAEIAERLAERKQKTPEYIGKSDVIKDAIKYLKENYMEDIELAEVAGIVHVNPSYLSALFRKETGFTFSQQLNAIRLDKGKEMLKTTNLSLGDIARVCGFTSESYFIKIFKEYYNETPGKYRRGNVKENSVK